LARKRDLPAFWASASARAASRLVEAAQHQKDAAVQRQTRGETHLGLDARARLGQGGQDGGAVGRMDGGDQTVLEQGVDRQGGGRRAIGGQGGA
jgi:hypothetical protein